MLLLCLFWNARDTHDAQAVAVPAGPDFELERLGRHVPSRADDGRRVYGDGALLVPGQAEVADSRRQIIRQQNVRTEKSNEQIGL